MTSSAMILPICTLQHDFQSVIQDVLDGVVPDDKFWVSCYKLGEPSVHGKVTATLDDRDRNKVLFRGHDGVALKEYGKVSLHGQFHLLSLSMQTKFAPLR